MLVFFWYSYRHAFIHVAYFRDWFVSAMFMLCRFNKCYVMLCQVREKFERVDFRQIHLNYAKLRGAIIKIN